MAKHTVYLASECHRSVTVVESDPCVICVSDTPISHITKTSYRWTLVFSAGKPSHLPTLQPRQTEAHSENHCQYPSGTQCQSYCCGWSAAAQQLHRCTVHSVYVHVCYCTICRPSCEGAGLLFTHVNNNTLQSAIAPTHHSTMTSLF